MPMTPTTVEKVPFGAVVAHIRRQITVEGLSPRQVAATIGLPAAQVSALAGITPPAPAPAAAAGGDRASVRLPAGVLHIDRTYQRALDPGWIRRRTATFDPALLGTLEVSDRGPDAPTSRRWAVIDGQHRHALTLAAAGPDRRLACRVHTGLTVADEAALYRLIDAGRRSLTRWDRWKARRAEGDPTVLEIERIVAAPGLRLAPTRTGGTVTSVRAAEHLHTLGGPQLLTATLTAIVGAWDLREPIDHDVLTGVGLVRHHYRPHDLPGPQISTGLTQATPEQLRAQARALRDVHRTSAGQSLSKATPGRAGWYALGRHLVGYHLVVAVMVAATWSALHLPLTGAGAGAGLAISVVTHAVWDRRWPVAWVLAHCRARGFAALALANEHHEVRWRPGMYAADQALHTACLWAAALIAVIA